MILTPALLFFYIIYILKTPKSTCNTPTRSKTLLKSKPPCNRSIYRTRNKKEKRTPRPYQRVNAWDYPSSN